MRKGTTKYGRLLADALTEAGAIERGEAEPRAGASRGADRTPGRRAGCSQARIVGNRSVEAAPAGALRQDSCRGSEGALPVGVDANAVGRPDAAGDVESNEAVEQ